jgi:NitT/TauT family transport system substrate-binding protein
VVLDNGSTLPAGHQEWQLNEILGLIFPATNGIGVMNANLWNQTVEIATAEIPDLQGVNVSDDAYRTDLAEKAIANLSDSDTDGDGYSHRDIELKEGGE